MIYSSPLSAISQSSALSGALLTQSQAERMVSATNAEEAFRVLYDLSWASSASDSSGVDDFENVIDAGLLEVKKALSLEFAHKDIAYVLFLPFDLQNAKATLSAFLKQKQYEDIRENLSFLGFFPRKTAYNILSGKERTASDDFLRKALLSAKKLIEESPENIQEAQNILDAAFYKKIYDTLQRYGKSSLQQVFANQIDGENIKRILRSTQETVFFLAPWEPSGFLSLSNEQAKAKMEFSPMKSFLLEGEDKKAEGESVAKVEIKIDLNIIQNLFWEARSNPLGEENILLLFLTKLRNAEVIRTILVGKRNGFSENEIRELISVFLPLLPAA